MLTRELALDLLDAQNPDMALRTHSLASEAVMRGLARHFEEDVELWGLTGLLHDVDFSHTKDTPERHGLMAMDILTGKLPEQALYAIRAHNTEYTGVEPENRLDFALRCAESVTGLVAANALVRPDGIRGMSAKSLKKKMKEKAFAANVNRERIRECEKIGLELGAFFDIAVAAMTAEAAILALEKA